MRLPSLQWKAASALASSEHPPTQIEDVAPEACQDKYTYVRILKILQVQLSDLSLSEENFEGLPSVNAGVRLIINRFSQRYFSGNFERPNQKIVTALFDLAAGHLYRPLTELLDLQKAKNHAAYKAYLSAVYDRALQAENRDIIDFLTARSKDRSGVECLCLLKATENQLLSALKTDDLNNLRFLIEITADSDKSGLMITIFGGSEFENCVLGKANINILKFCWDLVVRFPESKVFNAFKNALKSEHWNRQPVLPYMKKLFADNLELSGAILQGEIIRLAQYPEFERKALDQCENVARQLGGLEFLYNGCGSKAFKAAWKNHNWKFVDHLKTRKDYFSGKKNPVILTPEQLAFLCDYPAPHNPHERDRRVTLAPYDASMSISRGRYLVQVACESSKNPPVKRSFTVDNELEDDGYHKHQCR